MTLAGADDATREAGADGPAAPTAPGERESGESGPDGPASRLDALVAGSTGIGAVVFGLFLGLALADPLGPAAALPGLFFVAAGLLSVREGLGDGRPKTE